MMQAVSMIVPHLPWDIIHLIAVVIHSKTIGATAITRARSATMITILIRFPNIVYYFLWNTIAISVPNLLVEEIRYASAYPMFYSNTNFRITGSVRGISILISTTIGSAKSTMSIPLNFADKHSSFVL